ncbi:MAG: carboxypeptidase regulatory-like domain-containing protein [Acidobacteriota bacterium]
MPARILVVVLSLLVALPAAAGEIIGTVRFTDSPPRLPSVPMDADPQCVAKHDAPVAARTLVLGDGGSGAPTMANVFVQVVASAELLSSAPAPPAEPVIVDQVGCLYEPRVVGVRSGQPLVFKNTDGIFHNVHLKPARNPVQNIAMPPFLKEKQTTFAEPELYVPVSCDVHPWMRAFVAVMEHPYFAVTGTDGRFAIDGLPAGSYTLRAWHEKLGTREQQVEVPADGAATADFSVSRSQ